MNKINKLSMQDKTLSNISLLVTTAGFLAIYAEQTSSFNIEAAAQTITPSSTSLVFSTTEAVHQNALDKLEDNLEDLWASLDDDSFSVTDKELEVAQLMLDKFPNHSI